MAADAATGSIADRVAQSLAAFKAIAAVETPAGVEPGDADFTFAQTISDQLSKFKLWAGNIGAHRTGRSSLDYRLRDSSHLHTQVMTLLDDLITSLHEVHSILSGETLPWDQDPGEVGELDQELKDLLVHEVFEFDSELGQLTKEIADIIGNLLRLSMALRNPAPHDRFMSTEYAKVRYFEANDKGHVEAKFKRTSQTLIIRLGQALSQRRQYFRYRESHHEKLARGLFDSGRSEAGAQSTVASSIPLTSRVPVSVPVSGELDEDERSDTGFSQTSFSTTAPGSERLRIPPLPKKSYDSPFECPLCFLLISVRIQTGNTSSATCGHTLARRKTVKQLCGSDHTTETNLRQHIIRNHDGSATEMELDAMIARCGRSRLPSPSSPVECPLCRGILESVQQYQRHVGRHQVDLSLFALPKITDDDEGPDEQNEDQEAISTLNDSYSEDECEANMDLSEPERLDNYVAERQDSEEEESNMEDHGFIDEPDDVELRVEQRESREERSPLPPAAVLVINNPINLSDSESSKDGDSRRRGSHRNPTLSCNQKQLEERVLTSPHTPDFAALATPATRECDSCNQSNQECVFQPVSSTSSTEFVPVSALRNNATIDHEGKRRELYEAKEERDKVDHLLKHRIKLNSLKEEEAEERELEDKQRRREKLFKSGLDEIEVNAVMDGRIEEEEKDKQNEVYESRPTYTRMARRHLSLETLRIYDVDYVIDTDPEYVLIKRWVPESEQDILWQHTRLIREQRAAKLEIAVEDGEKKSHYGNHAEPGFERIRKKERKRSKSPHISPAQDHLEPPGRLDNRRKEKGRLRYLGKGAESGKRMLRGFDGSIFLNTVR
ncbi:hypothetical protein CHU98_g1521 [Xylaria longipes]|nr:hypothetical protein CHU98_g1521 [Xylaria longipes]